MSEIRIENVSKIFPGGVCAVDDVSLPIDDGEFAVLVGPSGSGKSTVLRMIAGLEEVTSGRIIIDQKVVNDLPPKARDIAMVFQDYALYPQMTAYETMEFALRIQRKPKPERQSRVLSTASMLGIRELLSRKPQQLSGGQRQRVAMGRAIVREPRAFLMDEPLSNLDAKLRGQMRAEIGRLHQRLGTTTVLVTHDQIEAMTMADRIAVMRDGRIEQVDAPKRLYDAPRNLFVAGFIGSPPMNLLRATLVAQNGSVSARFGPNMVNVPAEALQRHRSLEHVDGRAVILGIRPESIEDAGLSTSDAPESTIEVDVGLVEPMGAETVIHFNVELPEDSLAAMELVLESSSESDPTPALAEAPFSARLSPRTAAREGQAMRLTVDTSRLYLFDPSTEHTL